jgi:thymidine phosphorylase
MDIMQITKLLLAIAGTLLLAACRSATPQEQLVRAQAEYTEEQTKTMQQYKKCISEAGGDQARLDTCERILKAIDPGSASAPAAAPAPPPAPPDDPAGGAAASGDSTAQ